MVLWRRPRRAGHNLLVEATGGRSLRDWAGPRRLRKGQQAYTHLPCPSFDGREVRYPARCQTPGLEAISKFHCEIPQLRGVAERSAENTSSIIAFAEFRCL